MFSQMLKFMEKGDLQINFFYEPNLQFLPLNRQQRKVDRALEMTSGAEPGYCLSMLVSLLMKTLRILLLFARWNQGPWFFVLFI